jgi:hypothetical protein
VTDFSGNCETMVGIALTGNNEPYLPHGQRPPLRLGRLRPSESQYWNPPESMKAAPSVNGVWGASASLPNATACLHLRIHITGFPNPTSALLTGEQRSRTIA